MANEIFNKVRSAGKDYLGSVSGDYNQIKNTLGSKFGSLENLSNTFDQRVADGLTDLLSGATGIRTSSIPEISAQVLNARTENRTKRQEVLNEAMGQRVGSEQNPIQSKKLTYPLNFITEEGSGASGAFTGYSRIETLGEMAGKPGFEDITSEDISGSAKQTMTNYIHFRTLKRRVVADEDNEQHYDIFLYVPNKLSDAITTTYSAAEKGLTEGAIASIFPLGGSGWFSGNQFGTKEEIMEILKSGAPGSDVIKATAGRTVNPLKFQLFEGVNMRTYTYDFEFRPLDDKDSEEIRHIAYAFRKSMLPGTIGKNSRVYTFPNEWAIRYHGPIKQWVDYPMTTVCTNATVDWAPNGFTHYTDGAPTTTTLSLTFTELVTLDRDRFDNRSSAHLHHSDEVREDSQRGSIGDISKGEGGAATIVAGLREAWRDES